MASENSNDQTGSSKLRLVVLVGLLGLAVFALWYDYKVARPAVELAYDQITLANDKINTAAEHRRMTSVDVQKVLGRSPSDTFVSGSYTVEAYRWSAGMPLEFRGLSGSESPGVGRKTHSYYAVYRPDGPDLAFVTHYKFDLDPSELLPKPVVLVDGDEDNVEMEMRESEEGYGGPPGGGGFAGGGPGGGGGRGGFDPEAMFAERDVDGDGKLTGDEISDRMRENLEATDTDGDGAVSKEELIARMSQFRGRRGGGGERGGSGEGDEGSRRPQRPALESTDDNEVEAAGPTEPKAEYAVPAVEPKDPQPTTQPEAQSEKPAAPADSQPSEDSGVTSSDKS